MGLMCQGDTGRMAHRDIPAGGAGEDTGLAGIVAARVGTKRQQPDHRDSHQQGQQRRADLIRAGSVRGSQAYRGDTDVATLVGDLGYQLTDGDLASHVRTQRGGIQNNRDLVTHAASSSIRWPSCRASAGIGAASRSRHRDLP